MFSLLHGNSHFIQCEDKCSTHLQTEWLLIHSRSLIRDHCRDVYSNGGVQVDHIILNVNAIASNVTDLPFPSHDRSSVEETKGAKEMGKTE